MSLSCLKNGKTNVSAAMIIREEHASSGSSFPLETTITLLTDLWGKSWTISDRLGCSQSFPGLTRWTEISYVPRYVSEIQNFTCQYSNWICTGMLLWVSVARNVLCWLSYYFPVGLKKMFILLLNLFLNDLTHFWMSYQSLLYRTEKKFFIHYFYYHDLNLSVLWEEDCQNGQHSSNYTHEDLLPYQKALFLCQKHLRWIRMGH